METLKSLLHSLKRVLIIIAVIALLVLSIRVTKPDLVKLVSSFPKAKSIMGQLLRPEILGRESGNHRGTGGAGTLRQRREP